MTTVPTPSVDPITFAVVRHGLIAANRIAASALERTAMMPLIYESQDYATSYFDSDVQLVAEMAGHPLFAGSLTSTVPAMVEYVGAETLSPGDVIITNLSHLNGSHPPDVVLAAPIYLQGDLLGYFAARAHVGDMGGVSTFPTTTTEALQEGLMLPPMRLFDRGVLDEKIMDIIRHNSRTPEMSAGDVLATYAAVQAGGENVRSVVAEHGVDTYRRVVAEILDHGERMVRQGLRDLNDGVYTATGALDDNGVTPGVPVPLQVTVTIEGEHMTVDLTGSAPEQQSPINSPWPYTQAIAHMAVKTLACPDIPCNAGERRAFTLIAPEGTVVNCSRGAASFRAIQPHTLLSELIINAVTQANPATVPAMSGVDCASANAVLTNAETGRIGVIVTMLGHGKGAKLGADGASALYYRMSSGIRLEPAEILEARHAAIRHRIELKIDSGGAGQWRGGLGVECETEYLGEGVAGSGGDISSGVTEIKGAAGGSSPPHQNGVITYYRSDHEIGPPASCKQSGLPVGPGDRVLNWTAGGGGYGPALERDVDSVLWDLDNGYVSPESARKVYAVVVTEDGEVDLGATSQLRAERAAQPTPESG